MFEGRIRCDIGWGVKQYCRLCLGRFIKECWCDYFIILVWKYSDKQNVYCTCEILYICGRLSAYIIMSLQGLSLRYFHDQNGAGSGGWWLHYLYLNSKYFHSYSNIDIMKYMLRIDSEPHMVYLLIRSGGFLGCIIFSLELLWSMSGLEGNRLMARFQRAFCSNTKRGPSHSSHSSQSRHLTDFVGPSSLRSLARRLF